jgi:hypothetical protein
VGGWVGPHSVGTLIQKDTDKQFAIGRVDQSWDSGDLAIVYPFPTFLGV